MNRPGLKRGFGELFSIMGSAIAVSSATRSRQAPRDADLERLGIDPTQFRSIKHW